MLKRIRVLLAAGIGTLMIFGVPVFRAAAYEEITAEIPVACDRLQDAEQEHQYEITILGDDELTPMPEDPNITVKGGESGAFEIAIAEPGTYKYTVSEVVGGDEYIDYDRRIYDITVFVTNTENDELSCIVSATAAGTDVKPDKIRFADGGGGTGSRRSDEDNSGAQGGDSSSPDNGNAFTGSGGITAAALFAALIFLIVFRKRDSRKAENTDE